MNKNKILNFVAYSTLILAVAIFAMFLCPKFIYVFNDDFGYLRSIVRTIQSGRVWTDDWLEPWSATLSAVAWAIYSLTHRLILTVNLIQIGSFLATAFALHKLCSARTTPYRALLSTASIIIIPSLLYKFSELGGMMLYIPCLLWGLHFSIQERWTQFTICTLLALGCRQGAIAWLAIPGIYAILYLLRSRTNRFIACLISIIVCLFAYVLLSYCMNRTYAQVVMTGDMWRSLDADRFVGNFFVCLPIFLIGPGLAMLVIKPEQYANCPSTRVWITKCRLRVVKLALVLALCIISCLLYHATSKIGFEHPMYSDVAGRLWFYFLCLLALAGFVGIFLIDQAVPLLGAAVAAMLLVCLRGAIYDYYCVDMVLLAFAASLAGNKRAVSSDAPPCSPVWKNLQTILLTSVLLFGLMSVHRLWRHLEEMATRVYVAESALQKGVIAVDDLAVAPFGLQGWHLFPYFVRHEGVNGDYIANFQNYLRADAVEMRETTVQEASSPNVFSVKLNSLTPRRYYRLDRKLPRPPAVWTLPSMDIESEAFPLTEQAWRELLSTPAPQPARLPCSK